MFFSPSSSSRVAMPRTRSEQEKIAGGGNKIDDGDSGVMVV